jgi:hypothetical protein
MKIYKNRKYTNGTKVFYFVCSSEEAGFKLLRNHVEKGFEKYKCLGVSDTPIKSIGSSGKRYTIPFSPGATYKVRSSKKGRYEI